MAYAAFPQVDDKLKDKNDISQGGGDAGGIVGGGAPAQSSNQGGQLNSVRSPNAFLEANKGAEATDVTGGVRNKIEEERGNVKKAESEYEGKLGGADVINKDDVAAGISGAEDKFKQISNRLSGQYMNGAAPQYSYQQQNNQNLGLITQGVKGTEALLKQTHGPGYSAGMAQMDARLNQMNPAYKQQIQNVLQSKAQLDAEDAAAKTQAANALAGKQKEYDAYTGQLKNDLTGIGSGLTSQWDTALKQAQDAQAAQFMNDKANALNLAQSNLGLNPNSDYMKAKQEAQNYLNSLKDQKLVFGTTGGQSKSDVYGKINPQWTYDLEQILSSSPNIQNSISATKGSVGLGDVASAEDQAKFARLNQLLGGALGNKDFTKGTQNQVTVNRANLDNSANEQAALINQRLNALKSNVANANNATLVRGSGGTAPKETDIGSSGSDWVKQPNGQLVNKYTGKVWGQ